MLITPAVFYDFVKELLMNIVHVISFIETLKLGSISAAAIKCNLSQSALSQQIQALEKSFNTKLIERSHKGITPTPSGKIAYSHFVSILDSYNDIFQDIDKLNSSCETIKVISTAFACAYALPCTFYHFKNKYPNHKLEIETAQSDTIEQKIIKGQADVGIVIGQTTDNRIHCQQVFSDEFFLVCNQSFDIPESVHKEDIYKYPVVMLTKTHRTQQLLVKQLLENGIEYDNMNLLYSVDTVESMKLFVTNGFGVAFLPYMAIKKELYNKQLRIVKCSDLKLLNSYYSITQRNVVNYCVGKDKIIQYLEKIMSQTIC